MRTLTLNALLSAKPPIAYALIAVSSLCGSIAHAAIAPVTLVAGSWQNAPGSVHNYSWVGMPRGGQVSDDGVVSFGANFGSLSANGLWSGLPGAIGAIALPGQPAPGYPAGNTYYGNFFGIKRLDNGQFLYGGSVTSTDQAWWKGPTGSPTRILRRGDLVTSGASATFGPVDYLSSFGNSASDGSYLAWWGPITNKNAVLLGTPGSYRVAQGTNDFVDGNLKLTQLYTPSVSKAGKAVFKADYTESNQSKTMLRIADMTSTSSLAQHGYSVPGLSGYTWGSYFGNPVINDGGQVLFSGQAQRSFPYDLKGGLWLSNSARTAYTNFANGEHAPGLAAGVTLYGGTDYRLNNAGEVAFISTLSGSGVSYGVNDTSIWAGAPNALQMAMRKGDVAPQSGGATFASLSWQYGIQQFSNHYQLNDAGQVVFFAQLAGAGVSTSNDIGLWLFDPGANHSFLVAREGDQIDIGGGSFKTILELYAPYQSGTFNDVGQVSFGAKFTDGSQAILVSNVVAVPEPETYALMLAGLGLVGFAARRRVN